jgi:hypothetical protein
MLELTDAMILEDIAEFEARIEKARRKLHSLPKGKLPWQEHRKRTLMQRNCICEISHCQKLVEIAMSALTGKGGKHYEERSQA